MITIIIIIYIYTQDATVPPKPTLPKLLCSENSSPQLVTTTKIKKNKKKNIAQTKQTFNFCLSLILDCIELNLNITPFKGAPGPANIVNSKIIDISYIYSHRFGSCSLYVYHDSKILLQDPCTLTHLGSHSCH